LNFLH